jgi:murein L,D-transpeptidase YcbB/YkuD
MSPNTKRKFIAMHAGKERYVTLENKVSALSAYFIAFVDQKGRLNFRKDIYQLDEKLPTMMIWLVFVQYWLKQSLLSE